MRKLLLYCLMFPLLTYGQVIRPSASQINFGNVFEGTTDSIQITLQNLESSAITVTGFKFYTIYNEQPFFVKQQNFTIPYQGSQSIWVYFAPKQNILHNSEMIIQHNGTSGYEPIDLIGQGKFSNAYYNSTENLSEEALKTALKTRLGQGYTQLSYNGARDNMYSSIDNNGGQVECVYTGRTATFNSRSGANSNNFNCEHTFPQGFFNQNLPMRSDIHHLFSTDVTANSQRGNLPFGVVTGSGSWSQGGSKKSSGTFEPRNAQKGQTARAMMYFVIRYQDYANHFSGQENILRQWHNTYSPAQAEKARNNAIYAIQNNRNPFVDYPQLEKRITNFVSLSSAPQSFGLDVLQSSINFGNVINQNPDTFDYVLVNRGNLNINFSNFGLSNTAILSFGANSGTNTTLQPGEAIQIRVIIQTQSGPSNINETLSFSTNIPGSQSSFTIPITATSIVVGMEEKIARQDFEIFPNPVNDVLFINCRSKYEMTQVRILDQLGRQVNTEVEKYNSNQARIQMSNLSKGIYVAEILVEEQRILFKVIK